MPPKKKKAPEPEPEPAAQAPTEPQEESNERYVPGANEWEPAKIMIRPREQLQLSDKDLNEELTKILKADNPEAPKSIVRFSHKEKMFKADATVEQTEVHYSQEGNLLHNQSDDAKRQKEKEDDEKVAQARELEKKKQEGGESAADEGDGNLRNQFNFSERASQTLNNALRERGTMTEPPPSVEYSSQCTQVRRRSHSFARPSSSLPADLPADECVERSSSGPISSGPISSDAGERTPRADWRAASGRSERLERAWGVDALPVDACTGPGTACDVSRRHRRGGGHVAAARGGGHVAAA